MGVSLKNYNTFHINVSCKEIIEFHSIEELQQVLHSTQENLLVLGGGSNVLLTKNIDHPVLINRIEDLTIIEENDQYVLLKVGAGVVWHTFVLYCIEHNWSGVENLSLIPGSVGASPIQNIGAYGVEVKDVIVEVHGLYIDTCEVFHLTNAECQFSYRDSIFKHSLKHKTIITQVIFKLYKSQQLNTHYGAIKTTLEKMGIHNPSIKDVSNAVIQIRSSKLPDPQKVGNAGSFFKNPEISKKQFYQLISLYPNMPSFQGSKGMIKIPSGWLIEQCGWKGYRKGDVGCWPLQALVLVNYGDGTGEEILALADQIKKSVINKFGIQIQAEVNIF